TRQFRELAQDTRRRLRAEDHARSVESAEGTVMLLPPPAAARALERNVDVGRSVPRTESERLGTLEEFSVVGNRQPVQVLRRGAGRHRGRSGATAAEDAGRRCDVSALV